MENTIKELLRKPWLNTKELRMIYPVGKETALKMMRQAKEKAINENWFIPVARPPVVPTQCVMELFPLKKPRRI